MRTLWRRESPLWKLAWAHKLKGGGGEPVWATAAGNPITISAMAAPLQALRVDFGPVQAGSGTPAPDNVRPITGFSELKVHIARNVNLFVNSGWEKALSTISAVDKPIAFEDADAAYTFYNIDNSMNCYIFAYDGAGNFVGRTSGAKRDHLTITRTSFSSGNGTKNYETIRSFMFRYYNVPEDVTPAMVQASCRIMLLRGTYDESRQGTYVSGVIDTYTAAFGAAGPVYGGYIDLVTGELVVTRGCVTVDGSSYRISGKANTQQSDRVRFYTAANSIPNLNYGTSREADLVVSNVLGTPNGASDDSEYAPPLICAGMYNSQFYFAFPLSYGLTTAAEANAWLAEHPIQVSYLLRTPEHIQLSPQVIRTIRGSNTIITDGDAASVTFVEAWQ